MKKLIGMILALAICLSVHCALAGNWSVPGGSAGQTVGNNTVTRVKTTFAEDSIATRTGPSQDYTGSGTMFHMKDRQAVALAQAVDASGICWVEIEVDYNPGAYRICWVGAKRLNLTNTQLKRLPYDYEFALGEGTVNQTVALRMGPGSSYIVNKDYSFSNGTEVMVVASDGDYYIVERMVYNQEDGRELILRCWVPASCVTMK